MIAPASWSLRQAIIWICLRDADAANGAPATGGAIALNVYLAIRGGVATNRDQRPLDRAGADLLAALRAGVVAAKGRRDADELRAIDADEWRGLQFDDDWRDATLADNRVVWSGLVFDAGAIVASWPAPEPEPAPGELLAHAVVPDLDMPPASSATPRPQAPPQVTTRPGVGRPSMMDAIKAEMNRRAHAGKLAATLKAESVALMRWAEGQPLTRGNVPTDKTIRNELRGDYRSLKKGPIS